MSTTNYKKQSQQESKQENLNSKEFNTLQATLDLALYPRQISQFRGAFTAQAGWEKDHLHNHKGKDKYHYRYPLIQYRIHQGKISLIGIGEGSETLRRALLEVREIQLGNKKIPLRISHLTEQEMTIKMTSHPQLYRLMNWVPFNQENYIRWKHSERLSEKIQIMEKMLVGQIITLANGVEWKIPERFEAFLVDIVSTEKVKVHGQECVAFNVMFKCNIDIPVGLGIGRSVAFGYGGVYPFLK